MTIIGLFRLFCIKFEGPFRVKETTSDEVDGVEYEYVMEDLPQETADFGPSLQKRSNVIYCLSQKSIDYGSSGGHGDCRAGAKINLLYTFCSRKISLSLFLFVPRQ